jgi:hypothetical protein
VKHEEPAVGSICRICVAWCVLVRAAVKLGGVGAGVEWGSGRRGEAEAQRGSGTAGRMLGCRSRIVSLRKTDEVMRFCDHGGAADFYKRGICRGIWMKIVLELWAGLVGFLIKNAQRAAPCEVARDCGPRRARRGVWVPESTKT